MGYHDWWSPPQVQDGAERNSYQKRGGPMRGHESLNDTGANKYENNLSDRHGERFWRKRNLGKWLQSSSFADWKDCSAIMTNEDFKRRNWPERKAGSLTPDMQFKLMFQRSMEDRLGPWWLKRRLVLRGRGKVLISNYDVICMEED